MPAPHSKHSSSGTEVVDPKVGRGTYQLMGRKREANGGTRLDYPVVAAAAAQGRRTIRDRLKGQPASP